MEMHRSWQLLLTCVHCWLIVFVLHLVAKPPDASELCTTVLLEFKVAHCMLSRLMQRLYFVTCHTCLDLGSTWHAMGHALEAQVGTVVLRQQLDQDKYCVAVCCVPVHCAQCAHACHLAHAAYGEAGGATGTIAA
jgi:hypothetical protein